MHFSAPAAAAFLATAVSALPSASPADDVAAAAAASASKCQWTFPTAGCSAKDHGCYLNNDDKGYTLKSNNVSRAFTLHIPNKFDASKPSPLIVSYHAHSKNADYQYNLSSLYNPDFNPGWLSVYPQGLPGRKGERAWQGPDYAATAVNDTLFTTDLLSALDDCFSINKTAVYAMGKSNGGGFVDTLACSPAGARFAAYASCSGAFYTDNALSDCPANKRARRPYIDFHGGDDPVIHYPGDKSASGGPVPPIPKWLDWWGQRNGCAAGAGKNSVPSGLDPNKVNLTSYSCSAGSDVVQGYWIGGMGHDWPSKGYNLDNQGNPKDEAPFDATPLIIKFFQRWSL